MLLRELTMHSWRTLFFSLDLDGLFSLINRVFIHGYIHSRNDPISSTTTLQLDSKVSYNFCRGAPLRVKSCGSTFNHICHSLKCILTKVYSKSSSGWDKLGINSHWCRTPRTSRHSQSNSQLPPLIFSL